MVFRSRLHRSFAFLVVVLRIVLSISKDREVLDEGHRDILEASLHF